MLFQNLIGLKKMNNKTKSIIKNYDEFKNLKITICGMGVMGASLGYQLVKDKRFQNVTGLIRNAQHASKMLKMKIAHNIETNIEKAMSGSSIIILAIPSFAIESTIKELLPHLNSEMLIMDLCSVKKEVVNISNKLLKNKAMFVGAHPMTGTEKTGYTNFIPDLYCFAPCILTPTINTDKTALKKAENFWQMLKVKLFQLSPEEHDEIIGNISHLPHAISFALMDSLLKKSENQNNLFDFAGGSFRDMTRISKSSPELWADILLSNQKEVIRALKSYKNSLKYIENKILKKDFKGLKSHFEKIAYAKEKLNII